MLFKAVVVALVAVSAVSADLASVTLNMRTALQWLGQNSPLDHNSTIILGVASGSLRRQESPDGIETQLQTAMLDLMVAMSRELLSKGSPSIATTEAKLYFKPSMFTFVGDFLPENTIVNNEATSASPTVYAIYEKSQPCPLYIDCVTKFYAENLTPFDEPSDCVISPECKTAVTDPSSEIGPTLRNRFMMIATKFHKCNNFNDVYVDTVKGQMQELNDEVNIFLAAMAANDGKIDSRLRYTFLRKIILMAINGYNAFSINPAIETYVTESLYNAADGYCGVAEDVPEDKVILTSQCYAIWAFIRQVLSTDSS